jgi:lipopolysaccharide export LptBFGC system permease protein LptF
MSNSERPGPPPNPNATIQLSALDAADLVQFDNAEADEGAAAGAHGRVAPPPLPPVLPQVSAPVATAAPSRGVVFYGAVFVVFLVVAVGAGLAVGSYARSRATPVASSAPPVVAPAQVPTAAASAAPHTLVIPTVEVSSP